MTNKKVGQSSSNCTFKEEIMLLWDMTYVVTVLIQDTGVRTTRIDLKNIPTVTVGDGRQAASAKYPLMRFVPVKAFVRSAKEVWY